MVGGSWVEQEESCKGDKSCLVGDTWELVVVVQWMEEEVEAVGCSEQCACDGGSAVGACVGDDDDVGGDEEPLWIVGESMCESVVDVIVLVLGIGVSVFEDKG